MLANQLRAESITTFSFSNFLRENRLILAFLAVLVFVSYSNSFGNGFVSDDIAGIATNVKIGNISYVFDGPLHFSLQALFYFFAYHIGGLHPLTFRIINIFAHLGSVILVYLILYLIAKKRIAIIAASLFAVHPILIESVSWISGGSYSQYAFFFLLSFSYYLLSKNNQKYLYYSIAFYILSLLSSEKVIVLFLVFALYELAFGSLRQNWKKILPFFLISIALILLYLGKVGERVSAVESMSYQQTAGLENPFIQVPVAVVSYLGLIFWPAKLTLYHTEMVFSQGMYFLIVLIFLIFSGIIIYSYKKNKAIFFWLTFFIITLLPTLTPFKISWIVAERYVYLGTLGIIICVAMLFDSFIKLNENSKMVGYFALVIIFASLSTRTITRNQDWRNEDNLWIATAKVAPSGQNIHNNLGDVYARQGDLNRAVEEFKKAIKINPNYADAYHNLANTYQQMGQTDAAIEYYKKALELNPKLWQSYQNMAAIYYNQGNYDLAYENIKKALEINPNDENVKANVKVIEAKLEGK